ncbi:MAG: hypothetical protein VX370_04105 [Bacteroidota bacterium]|nr:hypothetical protein [Bacteroidota bacterium]
MRKILVILLCLPTIIFGQQNFIPGQSYFGQNNYVEYIAGNLPIIIGVPHGGILTPSNLPVIHNRGVDNGSFETSMLLYDSISQHTNGCFPHMIISHLHPSVMNPVREIDTAAGTHPDARNAWNEFHNFIDTSKFEITNNWGAGHYFEMHGNGHSAMWTEVGLGVSKTYLNGSDSLIQSRTNYSTVKNLCTHGGADFLEIIKGPTSLGGLLDSKGWNSVPSPSNPAPGTGGFFYAGWNTWKHGSRYSGVIDASHVENYYVFMQTSNRNHYSKDLSNSIIEFMNIHYGFVMDCTISSDKEVSISSERTILKKINILGKETEQTNQLLFYIYDDGTIEKKIIIE